MTHCQFYVALLHCHMLLCGSVHYWKWDGLLHANGAQACKVFPKAVKKKQSSSYCTDHRALVEYSFFFLECAAPFMIYDFQPATLRFGANFSACPHFLCTGLTESGCTKTSLEADTQVTSEDSSCLCSIGCQ